MGIAGSVADSPLFSYLQSEFDRVAQQKQQKNKLPLHSVQQLQAPQDCTLDLRHLATLWKLDLDHDGFVTFSELLEFAEFVNERQRILGNLDFHRKLRAQCVMELWEVIKEERGQERFADWVLVLISQGEKHKNFDSSPGVPFMSGDAVMTLYELLQPFQSAAHVDQQGFLDMLQQVGEHMNLMALQAEELDDHVPVQVVQKWVRRFIGAYANLFRELGLEPPAAKSGGSNAAGPAAGSLHHPPPLPQHPEGGGSGG